MGVAAPEHRDHLYRLNAPAVAYVGMPLLGPGQLPVCCGAARHGEPRIARRRAGACCRQALRSGGPLAWLAMALQTVSDARFVQVGSVASAVGSLRPYVMAAMLARVKRKSARRMPSPAP